MYNKDQYNKTVLRLAEAGEMAQPKTNVTRLNYYYQDNVVAIRRHMNNLLNTYGVEQLRAVLIDMSKDEP